ncbi:MAG: GrdX family protein, partial [Lachnospiraceae bacterium]|nr:GrdX family protein [Lachnospiraceae bacterium]
PMETPYKSVLIDKAVGELDFDSLSLIENAIATCKKFQVQEREFLPEVQADFQMIDRSLMESALDAAKLI